MNSGQTTQSPYETYSDWEKRTFCDNASRRGTGVGLSPQCVGGKREYECTVYYHKDGHTAKLSNGRILGCDTMVLCSACRERLKKSARKHGYKFQSKPLRIAEAEK